MKNWLSMLFGVLGVGVMGTGHSAVQGPFLYQLQNADPAAIAASGFKVVVMDPTRHGDEASRYSRSEIVNLVQKGISPIAYFSIGEAEDYRGYWQKNWVSKAGSNLFTPQAPGWLGLTNPDWAGNYKVRYWESDWRYTVLEPELKKIIAQGFKGVYLDIVDAFEYWGDPNSYGHADDKEKRQLNDPLDRKESAKSMIDLIRWIADVGRELGGPDFMVVPQNAEYILAYDHRGVYMDAIAGIGVEDVWYDEEQKRSAQELGWRMPHLRQLVGAGKFVLSVDYVDNGDYDDPANRQRIHDYLEQCRREGFLGYVSPTDRELDEIHTIEKIQPR
uniref:Glycoside-hydrolase family GH114 TIM-barrel domain-containing protein n=1 Tax=Magnetococcus massalia (strain MO-1) TaxID=451514 RepID=A0A1S7LIZ8_MAGMO|nr:Conserved exported protein of unknown function. Predicted extracellular endo alpha-1,4 polygalactosaminidase or related polysaccharide hydrolase [Candidatus Magnetococcus massalia]